MMPCNTMENIKISCFFSGQKMALATPVELAQQHEQHGNVFLVSSHEEIEGCAPKIGHFGTIAPYFVSGGILVG